MVFHRHFLLSILLLMLMATAGGAEASVPTSAEEHRYEVGILWFDGLAEAHLSLKPDADNGIYLAVLEGRTRGVIAFLTDHRQQRIESQMRLLPDGGFQTMETRSWTIKGKGRRKESSSKVYRFDFDKREVLRINGNHPVPREKILKMPEDGPVYDALTALYNLRGEYFGQLTPGRRIVIPTMTRKGPDVIKVEVLTDKQRKEFDRYPDEGILCRVEVSPEVFDTKGGGIYVWFDEQMVPAAGVIENAVGMGDIRGMMRTGENE